MSRLWNWNRLVTVPAAVAGLTVFLNAAALFALQAGTAEPPPAKQETGKPAVDEAAAAEQTLDEAVRDAIALANQGKYDDAIAAVEALRNQYPDDPRLPMFLVRLLNARVTELLKDQNRPEADEYIARAAGLAGEIVAATEADQLTGVRAFLSATIYNDACRLALAHQSGEALARLQEAFEWGYDDFDLASSDPDLASISDSDAFREMIVTQKRLMVERIHAETSAELAAFKSFPFDFRLPTVDEQTVALADFKGQVLVVDFWGTWCPPCRAEIPSFVRLKQQYGDRGLEIVGLTYERGENEEENLGNVRAFQSEFEVNYPLLMGSDDVLNQVPEFRGYPTTLFVDRTGTVRLQLVGLQSWEKLESVCQALLAEKQPGDE